MAGLIDPVSFQVRAQIEYCATFLTYASVDVALLHSRIKQRRSEISLALTKELELVQSVSGLKRDGLVLPDDPSYNVCYHMSALRAVLD